MMHHTGEPAVARAAQAHGLPYALSTMGTTSIASLREQVPDARLWFQLYMMRDRAATADLVAEAADNSYEALILTIDSAVTGLRRRDVKNGFSLPPALTARSVLDTAAHPRWWINFLTTEPLAFASVSKWKRPLAELGNLLFDPAVGLDDLHWLRETWKGPLIVKGVQSARDVRRVVDAGADVVVLSNHGGRQLDRAALPLRNLAETRQELGPDAQIWIDGGVLHGSEIASALALGADLVLVGRAYLYGLMAGGEAGVSRALELLGDELQRTLQLLGCAAAKDLNTDYIANLDQING
jgi:L-lactate dehydrogenase (cytochrome)